MGFSIILWGGESQRGISSYNDEDRKAFIARLSNLTGVNSLKIDNRALLPNHFQLLCKIGKRHLSIMMWYGTNRF
jgi:hypothetical protein